MDSNRLKRPVLERNRPIRTWSTLFGSPLNGVKDANSTRETGTSNASQPSPSAVPLPDPGIGRTLSDSVEAAYRVINGYMQQAQSVAQGFNPATWANGEQPGVPPDVQQLAQRVMQYGWDFAGMWFEMWTRMAGNSSGWPPPFPMGVGVPAPSGSTESVPQQPPRPRPGAKEDALVAKRLAISVVSKRRTAATFDFKPGPVGVLVVHALRPEGQTGSSIRDVSIDPPQDGETFTVKVVVPRIQAPGTYRGMIIDADTNLPRGSVSVTVYDESTEKGRRAGRRRR